MIHIERGPVPDSLRSINGENIKKMSKNKREALREELIKLFSGKCAYCETYVGNDGEIEHFVPMSLLNTTYWENLYYACHYCNRNKGARQPNEIVNGTEARKLLDPCQDDPAQHLFFLADGQVMSKTDLGFTTIEILVLNRMELVSRRKQAALYLAQSLLVVSPQDLISVLNPEEEFTALKRQVLLNELENVQIESQVKDVVQSFELKKKDKDSYSIKQKNNLKNYYDSYRIIEKIEISNFKSIEKPHKALYSIGRLT